VAETELAAIGFHMAMTTGESTRFSVLGIKSLPVFARHCALPSRMKAADAGLVRWGFATPAMISSRHSPEPLGCAVTRMALPPPSFTPRLLKSAVAASTQACFSDP
jgi:hypothetical protein